MMMTCSAVLLLLQALLIVLFPLHFFFHFLFYTDVGSLMFVLSAYLVRTHTTNAQTHMRTHTDCTCASHLTNS